MTTHWRVARVILGLMICGGGGRAADVSFDQLTQDANGDIWASSLSRKGNFARRDGEGWQWMPVAELHDATPVSLLALRDGSLACLWNGDGGETGALSRHHQGEAPASLRFAATLKEPHLLERRDGSVVITERGPTVIQAKWDAGARVSKIPDDLFRTPPKQNDSKERSYAPIRVLEDERQQLLLWSFALEQSDYQWRLGSLVTTNSDSGFERFEVAGIEEDTRISDIMAVDGRSLWVALVGTGIVLLDVDTRQLAPVRVPDDKPFQYVEQIFRDGADFYVVTCPRPSEFGSSPNSVRIAGRIS
ncbi:MAG: hypothetical protein ABI680_02125, partial [Chthoniobacteraceae bacterium]